MKEIEYKTDGVTYITPCPYDGVTADGEKIKVGSDKCFRCLFHRGEDDTERGIMHCTFDEMGKKNEAEPAAQDKECRQPRYHEGDMVWYVHTPELKYEATIVQVMTIDTEVVYRIHIDGEEIGYLRVLEDSLAPMDIDAAVAKVENPDGGQEVYQGLVNSPKYYNRYSVEVVEMARRIWGDEAMKTAAEITAFIYRMRAGVKPDNPWEQDIGKEEWWLNYRAQIKSGKQNNTKE